MKPLFPQRKMSIKSPYEHLRDDPNVAMELRESIAKGLALKEAGVDVAAPLDIRWCRKWIDDRRYLVSHCSELTAEELRMWGCILEELEKSMLAAVQDRSNLIQHQTEVNRRVEAEAVRKLSRGK